MMNYNYYSVSTILKLTESYARFNEEVKNILMTFQQLNKEYHTLGI